MGLSAGAIQAIQVATAVVAVAGAAEARQGSKAQRRASKRAERAANLQASRERREVVRQARIRRADILAQSANTGAAGSSAEAGAIGSLQTQVGTRLKTSFQAQELASGQARALRSASQSQARAGLFNTLGNFGASFIGPQAPKSKTPPTPPVSSNFLP